MEEPKTEEYFDNGKKPLVVNSSHSVKSIKNYTTILGLKMKEGYGWA